MSHMLHRRASDLSQDDGELQPLLPKVTNRRTAKFSDDLEAPDANASLPRFLNSQGSMQSEQQYTPHAGLSWRNDSILSNAAGHDSRWSFVEKLLDCPDFSDPKIDRRSLEKGRDKLLEALDGRPITGGMEEDLPNVMMFKGRPLFSACVIHLAVWCSARLCEASLVELVLKSKEDREVNFRAKYSLPSRKEGWTCELRMDAIHIAAGLGCLPAVEVLVRNAAHGGESGATPCFTPSSKPNKLCREYVNQFTVKYHTSNHPRPEVTVENFYTPIHEATAQGFIDVASYLLARGADGAAPNSDGVAPLHFLAMQGCAGGISTGMAANECAGVRKVVQAIQEAGGSLESRIPRKHWNSKWAGKTPLQLAAANDSRFPRQMMGLLVPCLQDDSVAEPRFFADVAFLTALDSEAAADVVREIGIRASRNSSVLQRFRIDAQMKGRTDMIAGILFLAPEAGGNMLDMLVGDPIVKDVSKHNIPTRTSLYGFWKHLPMRCIYRGDAVSRDSVLLPAWNFQTDRPFEKQPEIGWHRWLVPETDGLAERTDYVYNVSVSSVLLPNMLDLDMFMALARVLRPQMKVFSKLPVQGMIYCLWNNLVEGVWFVDLLFNILELIVLMWWSLAWPVYGPRGSIQADEPLCWAVITAGCVREATQLAFGARGVVWKHKGHTEPTMQALWHPCSEFMMQWSFPKLLVLVLQANFVWGARSALDDTDLSEADQVLLALTVLLKATQVTYSFRLCSGGSKIYAIFYSFLGGATREMISITAMIFGSFSLAFLVLAKDKAAGWVISSSYRALLFGDGDGFNNLGMDIRDDDYSSNNGMLGAFLVLGSFFFNIIILNLIIAVYGNEYDKVAGETPLLFMHGRARCCVTYIMSCQIFPWAGRGLNTTLWLLSAVLALAGSFSHLCYETQTWELRTAILFAGAQVMLMAAQAQAEWFSIEGIAADNKDHFLWMCHSDGLMEEEAANNSLQVGYFEERMMENRRYMDTRINSLEEKLDLVLQALGESTS